MLKKTQQNHALDSMSSLESHPFLLPHSLLLAEHAALLQLHFLHCRKGWGICSKANADTNQSKCRYLGAEGGDGEFLACSRTWGYNLFSVLAKGC